MCLNCEYKHSCDLYNFIRNNYLTDKISKRIYNNLILFLIENCKKYNKIDEIKDKDIITL